MLSATNLRIVDREPIVRAYIRRAKKTEDRENALQAVELARQLAAKSRPLRRLVAEAKRELQQVTPSESWSSS
jgi:hypothetical protein